MGFMLFTMIIKLTGAVVELMIPRLMETILDKIVPTGNLRRIVLYGGLMLLCAILCLSFNVIANRMTALSSGKITSKLRYDLFEKLQNLSAKQMDGLTISSAESRLTSDTYNVNQMLARGQRLGVRAPILVLGGVIMMLSMDPMLALVLIVLLPLVGVIVYFVTKTSVPLYTKEQSVLDREVQVLQENITGIRVIKALSKTEYEKKRFKAVNDELMAVDQKASLISAITNPSSSLLLNLGLTLMVVVGAFRVNAGRCQSGVIIAFLQYFVMILNAMLGITRIFVVISKGEASARRVADVLEMPQDLTVSPKPEEKPEEDVPHIEFRNVTFSYTGIGANLENLSFCLQHGQSLGILGATGSGKSTVLQLLMRFYDVQEGSVLIDGQDVRTIAPEVLREKFGVAFQNDFIAEGTIRDNIRFFREIDEENLLRAAHDAQAEEFIESREKKMDAEVAVRGNNLSGGQKQRLLIARALASRPEILLLDDSSSALDYKTDAELRKALHRGYGKTTTILVAQRVSSIRDCTRILVLSDGKTIGYGTHEQLMETCEQYRTIARSQMGEGKELA
ncbi:MAG: ABC transporter ATP-binding protein/permease [Clostridia bacterium]|nr:ABC transporter ATP-binding protein/permease [Clostridia bacterium]